MRSIFPVCIALFSPLALVAAEVDFNREIRPLLNTHCLKCHGGVKKKGGLSFLFEKEAFGKTESGDPAIVRGDAAHSALIERVKSTDKDERMPPEGDALSAEQIAKLEAWIAQGAKWDEHWAYLPPKIEARPAVSDASWLKTSVDAHVLARLDAEKLKPSPRANGAMLLRRLSLDLTGLPPTLEEAAAFSPERADAAIERLLASPRFGERWAAMWLDLARFADTQGYEKDNMRTNWAYRDWVIRAFNDDLPFDQFTIEQLAGDLLPNATVDQRTATAFHRNTMTNTEGGTDNEEFRTVAVLDRVNTTWETWMSTSFGCVQCHSHPYDPFTHREYYQFMAFLNNTEDADKDNDSPKEKITPFTAREARAQAEATLAAARAKLDAAEKAWRSNLPTPRDQWRPLETVSATALGGAELERRGLGEFVVTGENPTTTSYVIEAPAPVRFNALRLEALPHDALKMKGPGRAPDGNFVVSRIEAAFVLPDGKTQPVKFAGAEADFSQANFPVADALFGKDMTNNGWAIHPEEGKPHHAVFYTAAPVVAPAGARLRVSIAHHYRYPEQPGWQFTLGHFRLATSEDDTWRVRRSDNAAVAAARAEFQAAEKALAEVPQTDVLVMRELVGDKARKTQVFDRGNWLVKTDVVQPGVPGSLAAMPKDAPANRLGLARWIASRDNPLTARVIVNRVWEQLFGAGIVETVEDFGTMGALPSHPALLDELAVRFSTEMKWSLKALLREIVRSATYQQTSTASPELVARDPQNRLLARGPRFRLSAEMIRDQSLAAAGLLSGKMYGPSVMPPQPDGVWSVVYNGQQWKTPRGDDRYRRGLYTFWRRTSPYPSMMAFDSTSREFCVSRRVRTNTPVSALVTLNDPAFIEAARALGQRMATAPDTDARLQLGHRLLLGRDAPPSSLARLRDVFNTARGRFTIEPPQDSALGTTADEAALTVVGNVLLNLDAVLTKE